MAKGRGERREFWRQHIHAWRRSGQRREDYCHEHGLNPQTFNVWVGRLREEFGPSDTGADGGSRAETATFVPVEVTSESEAAAPATTGTSEPPIEIEAGGVTLRVAQDADTDVLTRVITAARRSA
jgi:transposase-like protein